jgi:hypothetical protein
VDQDNVLLSVFCAHNNKTFLDSPIIDIEYNSILTAYVNRHCFSNRAQLVRGEIGDARLTVMIGARRLPELQDAGNRMRATAKQSGILPQIQSGLLRCFRSSQ